MAIRITPKCGNCGDSEINHQSTPFSDGGHCYTCYHKGKFCPEFKAKN